MTLQRKQLSFLLLVLLLVGNILGQLHFLGPGLDNALVNVYNPFNSDGTDYAQRAALLADTADFGLALGDGYRMPGYPLFLALFFRFSREPLLWARLAQILLSSLVVPLAYLIIWQVTSTRWKANLGAAVMAVWPPVYYFSVLLLAESLSLFLVAILLVLLSRAEIHRLRSVLAIGLALALLVYLKPNHLLLLLPVAGYLAYAHRWQSLKPIAALALTVGVAVAPWTVFVSAQTGQSVGLSTNSGINLYLGTGVENDPVDPSVAGSLTLRTSSLLHLREDDQTIQTTRLRVDSLPAVEGNLYYTRRAREIWTSRPLDTALYGLSKVAHGFGFSLRGPRDFALVLMLGASLAMSLYLWRLQRHRAWVLFFWLALSVTAFQLFIYLPNQRFKTTLFDIPALLVLSLGMARALELRVRMPSPQRYPLPTTGRWNLTPDGVAIRLRRAAQPHTGVQGAHPSASPRRGAP